LPGAEHRRDADATMAMRATEARRQTLRASMYSRPSGPKSHLARSEVRSMQIAAMIRAIAAWRRTRGDEAGSLWIMATAARGIRRVT